MSARGALASAVASIAVLVLGWQIGQTHTPGSTATTVTGGEGSEASPSAGTTPSTEPSPSTAPSLSTGTSPSTGTSGAADGTYTGSSIQTRYGSVQVSVTVAGGRLTDVTAVKLTDDEGRSVQISNRAAPILRQEALTAQSADIEMVSGATYTSQGYISSLQSALDQAGL
ncbi:FMN-binding protein [Frigoribacterium sp. 2-23]|uniref:FMN-binding protein n=1 Tax=Frigoribacterium sp. 2-23 TaxID=3415006 RepID=UPI003C6EA83A